MYISRETILQIEKLYGAPKKLLYQQSISIEEMAMLQASQKNGRSHDVTFFIIGPQNQIAVIQKHFHQPGIYRAPSGGIDPDEDFRLGILREAYEETGLKITIRNYVLRIQVNFYNSGITVPWTSHIFQVSPNSFDLNPQDTHEIKEACWVGWQELLGPIRSKLLASESGLLHYRVFLTDETAKLLMQ